jgi:hypothetical protein
MSPDQRMAEGTSNRSTEVAEDDVAPERPRLELSIPQLLAGALAAASAAVAASWLGVAGTVIGAAVASVVVSVSSALYKHSLERSSQVIRETLPVLPVLPDRYRNPGTASSSETTVIEPTPRPKRARGSSPANARKIRWGVVAVSSLLTLVVGFGILTAVEAVIGRSAEQLTGHDQGGGTTVGQIFHHGSSKSGNDTKPTTPAHPSSTDGPSTAPATTAPTTEPPTTAPPSTAPQSTTAPPSTTAPASTTPETTQPPASQGPASTGGPH